MNWRLPPMAVAGWLVAACAHRAPRRSYRALSNQQGVFRIARPIALTVLLGVVGCSLTESVESCDYPMGFLGSGSHICLDYVGGVDTSTARAVCAAHAPLVAGNTSPAPCTSTGRVGRCRLTVTHGLTPVTQDLGFYTGTVADIMTSCPPPMPMADTTYELIPN